LYARIDATTPPSLLYDAHLGGFSASKLRKLNMVTVYTLPSCVQCDSTKRYLQRNLIEFQEVKLSENPEAMEKIKSLGFTQAPVVEAGESVWSGFRMEELKKLAA